VTARYAQCTSLTNSVERLLASVTDSLDFINKQEAQLSQTDWASAAHKIRREHLCDLEIYIKGQSMSLEMEQLDRSYTTYY